LILLTNRYISRQTERQTDKQTTELRQYITSAVGVLERVSKQRLFIPDPLLVDVSLTSGDMDIQAHRSNEPSKKTIIIFDTTTHFHPLQRNYCKDFEF